MPRRVFVFWQRGPLSATRAASLDAIRRHGGVETVFLNEESIDEWIVADAPLHPAFDRLSAVPGAFGAGYRKMEPGGVGTLGMEFLPAPRFLHATWWRRRRLQLNYWRMIGTCAFIVRPGSPFTAAWFTGMTRWLDGFAAALAALPARYPRDHAGAVFDGQTGGYPAPWTALLADVFHPLALRHCRRMLHVLPAPSFEGYQ